MLDFYFTKWRPELVSKWYFIQIKSDSKSRKWSLRRQRRKVPPSTLVSNLSSSLVNTTWVTEKPSVNSDKAKPSWSFWLTTPHNCVDPKSNTTLCWPRPVSTTTRVTTSNWELPAVNTSVLVA